MDYESSLWPTFCFKGLFAQTNFSLEYVFFFYWLKIYGDYLAPSDHCSIHKQGQGLSYGLGYTELC